MAKVMMLTKEDKYNQILGDLTGFYLLKKRTIPGGRTTEFCFRDGSSYKIIVKDGKTTTEVKGLSARIYRLGIRLKRFKKTK